MNTYAIALGTAIACCVPAAACADVRITEIMYDVEGTDSGREWIEIQNTGSEALDLTEWKFFEGDTNHGLTATGEASVPGGGYAIIADNSTKFKADWPSYTGLIFDSAFSLKNDGESLVMRCCGKDLSDVDTIAYASDLGAKGDGQSLHRSGSGFVAAAPSPGSGAVMASPSEPPVQHTPPQSQQVSAQPTTTSAPSPVPPAPPPAPPVQTVSSNPASPEVENPPASQPNVETQRSRTHTSPTIQISQNMPDATQDVSRSDRMVSKESIDTTAPAGATSSVTQNILVANVVESSAEPSVAAAAQATGTQDNQWMWWGGALALAIMGGFAVKSLTRKRGEWEIEEIQ